MSLGTAVLLIAFIVLLIKFPKFGKWVGIVGGSLALVGGSIAGVYLFVESRAAKEKGERREAVERSFWHGRRLIGLEGGEILRLSILWDRSGTPSGIHKYDFDEARMYTRCDEDEETLTLTVFATAMAEEEGLKKDSPEHLGQSFVCDAYLMCRSGKSRKEDGEQFDACRECLGSGGTFYGWLAAEDADERGCVPKEDS